MKDNYFDGMTIEELEILCQNANKELASRRKREQKEDWEKVVAVLNDYIKKYEYIEIDCDGVINLDSETTFPSVGAIHPALCF